MASRSDCSLCGKESKDREEYLDHLSSFHRIQRPQDFAEVVENLPQEHDEQGNGSGDTNLGSQCWKFKVGDLVMARLNGFPYWPGIVDKCPELSSQKFLTKRQYYVVRFFEESRTTIGNVEEMYIKKYDVVRNQQPMSSGTSKKLNAAIVWAEYVMDWTAGERFAYFNEPKRSQSDVVPSRAANLISDVSHCRTIKFKCLSCNFATHLLSVLEKHQRRRNHSAKMEKQEMKVILRGTDWKFKVGDLVMAKLDGYPYWPGIVDKCPQSESIYDMLVKRRYVVRFFDQGFTTIGSVQEKFIKIYEDGNQKSHLSKKLPAATDRRLNAAIGWAQYVLNWPANDRLSYFKNPELYQDDTTTTAK